MLASARKSVISGDWQPVAAIALPSPTTAAADWSAHKVSPAAMPPDPNSLTSSAFRENRKASGAADAAPSAPMRLA